jgi:hypothetical protein
VRLRRNDPRVRKAPRAIRVWNFEQTRAFAAGGRPEVRAATIATGQVYTSKEDALEAAGLSE